MDAGDIGHSSPMMQMALQESIIQNMNKRLATVKYSLRMNFVLSEMKVDEFIYCIKFDIENNFMVSGNMIFPYLTISKIGSVDGLNSNLYFGLSSKR